MVIHSLRPLSATAGGVVPSPRTAAFTLNELLVVLATLTVLALLVFPVLARSNDNDTRLVCLNNFRQMGLALNMYAGDNRDYLAYPNWDDGSVGVAGWLYTVNSSGTIPDPINLAPWKSNPVTAWQTGAWFQYVQNPKSYLCPVDIENADYAKPANVGGRVEKLSTYVMNGAVTGFPTSGIGGPCKITDVWSPACYLLWEPDENSDGAGNPGHFEYNDGANYPDSVEGIGRLHSPIGGHVLTIGGSVPMVTIPVWNAQAGAGTGPGPGGRTLTWWSPFAANGN